MNNNVQMRAYDLVLYIEDEGYKNVRILASGAESAIRKTRRELAERNVRCYWYLKVQTGQNLTQGQYQVK